MAAIEEKEGADVTRIEWTDATWNPVTGCSPVSAGCANCYAAVMARRLAGNPKTAERYSGLIDTQTGHFNGTVRCHDDLLLKPLRWRTPRMVFVCSMSDLFHPGVPDEFIDRVFAVMALTPQHTYQVLTKRPERLAELCERDHVAERIADASLNCEPWRGSHVNFRAFRKNGGFGERAVFPLPNLWLGTSCENQAAADERIRHLLRCQAVVLFVSCEPLLGPIRVPMDGLHWVIVGGESGPKARPSDIAWHRDIIAQCAAAQVPCFEKQLGSNARWKRGWDGRDIDHAVEDQLRKTLAWAGHDESDVDEIMASPDALPRMRLQDSKGGDPSEWPEDLRVRQWPEVKP